MTDTTPAATARRAIADLIRQGGLSPLQALRLVYAWIVVSDLDQPHPAAPDRAKLNGAAAPKEETHAC
ncbi:hypothetical protein [Oceanibaculum indicum]|uniref:Uncharacterized protein n=1 Tax=Oceanibaculum indicum P24 TaxID=1207063 RepID=K2JYV9_9PROT|nr:hypothetical protein [Oceanibaculum indicum]EKE75514.1 hypothetical protein P24_09846 [Oceanibaculum indicum P24]